MSNSSCSGGGGGVSVTNLANLSRTVGRSFRNAIPSISSPPSLPKSLSPASSYSNRRTSSGRYVPLSSRDDTTFESRPHDHHDDDDDMDYTVHIPATPDNQPMGAAASAAGDPATIAAKAEQQAVSETMFTGGFESLTRGRHLHKMTDSEAVSHPQITGARGRRLCGVEGCDSKAMRDERRGIDLFPCDCNYPICRDCYVDALHSGGGICPGCKEHYRSAAADDSQPSSPSMSISMSMSMSMSIPPPPAASLEPRMDRRLSLVKSSKSQMLMAARSFDFDHSSWLYETKGTYGYGNAVEGEEGFNSVFADYKDKIPRPLSREIKIRAAIISPYRYVPFFLPIASAR